MTDTQTAAAAIDAEAKTKPEPQAPPRPNPSPLSPGDVMDQTHAYQVMNAYIPIGVGVEDLTNPALWTGVAMKIQPGAEIRCVAEDMSFRALVFVRYKSGHMLNIEVLESKTFESPGKDAMPSSEYTVEWINNRYKYGLKGPDGEWIRKEIPSEAQAYRDRDEHIRAMRN